MARNKQARPKILYTILGLYMLYVCGGNLWSIWANIRYEISIAPTGNSFQQLIWALADIPYILTGTAEGSLYQALYYLCECACYLTLPVAAVMAMLCALRSDDGRRHKLLGWVLLARGVLYTLQLNVNYISALFQQSLLYALAALLLHFLRTFWLAALLITVGRWHQRKERKIPGLIELYR